MHLFRVPSIGDAGGSEGERVPTEPRTELLHFVEKFKGLVEQAIGDVRGDDGIPADSIPLGHFFEELAGFLSAAGPGEQR